MKCAICRVKTDKLYELILPPGLISHTLENMPILIDLPIEKNYKIVRVCKKCQEQKIKLG